MPRKKQRTSTDDNASDGPQEDNIRFANTLKEALAAPNLLHDVKGAGGLVTSWHLVGEHDDDEVEVLRAAVATAEAVLQAKKVAEKDRTNPLAEWPLVHNKDKLGEGAPDDFFDGHLPKAAQEYRSLRWTPQQLLVYLQARRQQQLIQPSRPKCCFCLSMLTYVTGCPLIRALMRQAYGPMWLADGDCVLVNRLLMEAIADRAVLALMKEDGDKEQWDRTTVVNVRTEQNGAAKFVGQSVGDKGKNGTGARKDADWALDRASDGVAADIYNYCNRLRLRDHGARIWADVTAFAMRTGNLVDGGVDFPGDDDVFTASNVDDKDVSLALLEDGSALKSGRLQLLVPVWCSVLKAMITMRLVISRKSVDAVSEPSLAATTDMRDAVMRVKDAEGSQRALQKVYREAKLVYRPRHPASNSPRSWIVAKDNKYDGDHPEILQKDLDDGFAGAERMREAAHAVAGRVAERLKRSAEDLAALCKDPKERAQMSAIIAAAAEKVRDSVPKTIPSATFEEGMINDFETFAGAVEKELNLSGLGCINGAKSGGAARKSKKRSSGGDPKPSSGGKRPAPPSGPRSKKPAAKRPKKSSSSSSSRGRREDSVERQQRLDDRHRVSANADPRAQEKGARDARAGRRKR